MIDGLIELCFSGGCAAGKVRCQLYFTSELARYVCSPSPLSHSSVNANSSLQFELKYGHCCGIAKRT